MKNELELKASNLVELDFTEMMNIDGGKSFAYWLGAALGVLAVVGLVILMVL
jgi:hypothetical protein